MAGVAWMTEAEAAFAQARSLGKPLFMYWGATWCPPCNRTKATVFQRADFAALADRFVALHIDGDSEHGQQLGARFALRSYPTLIVFRPDGAEVTRLPCEVDGERFMSLLRLALHAQHTAAQSLNAALSGARQLTDDEWTLLGFYSWDTDERTVLKDRDPAAALRSLAQACPQPTARTRFTWFALNAAAPAHAGSQAEAAASDIAALCETLTDPAAVRTQLDLVCNLPADLLRKLTAPDSPERARLAGTWSAALQWLESDLTLSVADRLQALRARVRLARLGAPFADITGTARSRVESARLVVSEPALRHTVINTAAGILSESGLADEAEALLAAELPRSHAPYYFMHNLAALSKKQGDARAALGWYEKAWHQAIGPATRLQWGATYLLALVDLTPADSHRIGEACDGLAGQVRTTEHANAQRNRTQLQRVAAKLGSLTVRDTRADGLLDAIRQADSTHI